MTEEMEVKDLIKKMRSGKNIPNTLTGITEAKVFWFVGSNVSVAFI